jgi:hypothetical protein
MPFASRAMSGLQAEILFRPKNALDRPKPLINANLPQGKRDCLDFSTILANINSFGLGLVAFKRGDNASALDHFSGVSIINPSCPNSRYYSSLLLEQEGNLDAALQVLATCVPSSVLFAEKMARLLIAKGNLTVHFTHTSPYLFSRKLRLCFAEHWSAILCTALSI